MAGTTNEIRLIRSRASGASTGDPPGRENGSGRFRWLTPPAKFERPAGAEESKAATRKTVRKAKSERPPGRKNPELPE